jgi:hypothetical protein
MSDKNKSIGKTIAFSLIFLIIGGVAGYFIGENSSKGNFKQGDMIFPNNGPKMNDSVKAEITSFFESTSDTEEINNYCQENPMYCMEYCRNINPSDDICEELNANLREGMPAR